MSAPIYIRPRPPLVVGIGRDCYAWVEGGRGFTLHVASGRWQPMTDAIGLGGWVLHAADVVGLVARFGRPT